MSLEIEGTVKLTPMMQQWHECKKEAKGAILFFRLGDFYEAFEEDAKLVAKELELTLTQRQDYPMCGIPWHASDGYIERLVSRGYRVAIAEQVGDPNKAKGLVTRKLVRVLSPATLITSEATVEKSTSFFAALHFAESRFGLALIDIASGTFSVFEATSAKEIAQELFRQSPKELLIGRRFQGKFRELLVEISLGSNLAISCQDDWLFDPVDGRERLCKHFKTNTLDGFGLKSMEPAITAAGAIIHYLADWQLCPLDHIRTIRPHVSSAALFLDRATLTNLEILDPQEKGRGDFSLASLLDETKTPMGARLLRQWLKSPLVKVDAITLRQDAVKDFLQRHDDLSTFDEKLGQICDLERRMYRIKTASAGPREYVALRSSLEQLPLVKSTTERSSSERLRWLSHRMNLHEVCVKDLQAALVDNPPFRASDGGLFRQGYHRELDDLKSLRQNSQEWLLNYQERLRQETGIKTLKVGYTRLFGYYIEVSRAQADKVPATFSRRQTLVNGERFITVELKEYEEKVLSANERIEALEEELFQALQQSVSAWHETILETAQCVAEIDLLRSLAIVAKRRNYFCPLLLDGPLLAIKEARHPIIESLASCGHFVTNDIYLDGKDKSLMCLTGPNMAGKSTYIRQVALLVIMAQIGSFIPAKEAKIGVVDKVFSRIGASDDLARGQSTFMVEMAETASILHQATERSLVILDEIGRGTSTYDGISIAWAVAEFLLKGPNRPKTLFATHYYELTELADKLSGAINYTVAISETSEGVVFLRKIVPGKADKSYGIHVARLAGMPDEVIVRAEELLKKLEVAPMAKPKAVQPDFFAPALSSGQKELLFELSKLTIEQMTPLQALLKLAELKKLSSK